jgi:hypothetical protein
MGNAGTRHPKFIAHQWKKGQSGNPKGSRKRESFESLVHRILDERIEGLDKEKREVVARVYVDMLIGRSTEMMREHLKREWPAPQKHEIGGINGGPITLADFVQLAREDYEPPDDDDDNDGDAPTADTDAEIPAEKVGANGRIRLHRDDDGSSSSN